MRVELPYTHAAHARRCREAAEARITLQQFVQVRYSGSSCCARILSAWDTPDGHEMWSLDLIGQIRGRLSMHATRVRQCSGLDGHCACAGEQANWASASSPEGAGSTPQGVTC